MLAELQEHNDATTTAMHLLDEAAQSGASGKGHLRTEDEFDEEFGIDEDELEAGFEAANAAASAVLEASVVYRRTNETSDGGLAFKALQEELRQRDEVIGRTRK